MNYNKIKKVIKNKKYPITDFIINQVGMSVTGFNQALANETLTVKKLEEISRVLNIPMCNWWEEEDQFVVEKSAVAYGGDLIGEIRWLKKQIDGYIDTIERLKNQIDQIEVQSNFKIGGSQELELRNDHS